MRLRFIFSLSASLLAVVATPVMAEAQPRDLAGEVADRYVSAMQRQSLIFMTPEKLAVERVELREFVSTHTGKPLDLATQTALLAGVDRCMDHFFGLAGTTHSSENTMWSYLAEPDYFRTLEWQLWVALSRVSFTPDDLQRRASQEAWLRQFAATAKITGIVHEGMSLAEVRPWVQSQLEQDFQDPLSLLYDPMSDHAFAELQARFDGNKSTNGLASDYNQILSLVLSSRFPDHADPQTRFGRNFVGQLPFNDSVVDEMTLSDHDPHLCFASNADFFGQQGLLAKGMTYDVIHCPSMEGSGRAASAEWEKTHAGGDITFDEANGTINTVRGAKMAWLPVSNWLEADKLSDESLAKFAQSPAPSIAVKSLPPRNGLHSPNEPRDKFFIVVQTKEKRLAVLGVENLEGGQLWFYCRPRPDRNTPAVKAQTSEKSRPPSAQN